MSTEPKETDKLASILLCTIDRFDLTKQWVGHLLASADYPFEFLVTDNGSSDTRVIDWVGEQKPVYHHKSKTNLGFPVAMNQMMQKAKGSYIVIIDNDTEVPNGWLRKMIETYESIPDTGQVALYSLMELHNPKILNGVLVRPGDWVFGVRLFHRSLMDKIGAICEDYGVYGLDDGDWSHRIRLSGLHQYYLDNFYAVHHGTDVGENTPYRRMKNECLEAHGQILRDNVTRYHQDKNSLFIPFVKRDYDNF